MAAWLRVPIALLATLWWVAAAVDVLWFIVEWTVNIGQHVHGNNVALAHVLLEDLRGLLLRVSGFGFIAIVSPIAAAFALAWRAPARLVLARPFASRGYSEAAQRLARRSLVPFGHVYTLADDILKVPWYLRIPVLCAQAAKLSFAPRRLRQPEDSRKLENQIVRRTLRNVNWLLTPKQLFLVSSSDEQWRLAFRVLAESADVVVFDLSGLKHGVLLEHAIVDAAGCKPSTLYICHRTEVSACAAWLRERFAGTDRTITADLYAYDENGAIEEEKLHKDLVMRIAIPSTGSTNCAPRASVTQMAMQSARTCAQCDTFVMPMQDGTCPACRLPIDGLR